MDIETIIIYGVLILITVGSWLANLYKKQQEERTEQERQAGGRPEAQLTDLDRTAARRREQLREVARQRAAAASGRPAGVGGVEPGNLTMAERVARARAKAQYEQRAAALQEKQREATAQRETAAQREAEVLRSQELQRQRQAHESTKRQIQQQARERARRQEALLQQQRRSQRAQRAQTQLDQQRQLQQEQKRQPRQQGVQQQRSGRRPSGTTPVAALPRQDGVLVSMSDLRGHSLLKAIALKEVLDRPVALRDPLTHPLDESGM